LLPIIYNVARPVVAVWLSLLCRRKVVRNHAALPEGPLIIVSNHLSWIDIPLLGLCFRRRIAFMGKKEYFHSPFHRFLMRAFGGFTVERGVVDRTALDVADAVLKDGRALGMFPEGTRSRTLQLQRGRLGAAFLASRSDAFILPVGVSGTEKIRRRYEDKRMLLHRPRVTVNIGEPFKVARAEGKLNRRQLVTSTETIMRRVADLLPEDYRGVYKDSKAD
jgi:1-acyl-sn-glycerol-3-phosphate acyltransferase